MKNIFKFKPMKQMTKIIIPVILLINFHNVFGQNKMTQISAANIYQVIANSEIDVLIRIDRDMNDEEINSRIGVLRNFVEDIEITYSRDESGNIKTLSSAGSQSSGSCKSDDFGFLIISLIDNKWNGCMISDKK
jgi:hypothetical protein